MDQLAAFFCVFHSLDLKGTFAGSGGLQAFLFLLL